MSLWRGPHGSKRRASTKRSNAFVSSSSSILSKRKRKSIDLTLSRSRLLNLFFFLTLFFFFLTLFFFFLFPLLNDQTTLSRSARAAVKVSAKYGDESRYFDLDVSSFLPFLFRSILSSFFPLVRPERDCSFLTLSLSLLLPLLLLLLPSLSPQDLENTAGSWDMYGQADGARYPGLQAEFFERAAAPVVRREALLGLLGLAFPSAVVAWGIKGAKDVKLPITVGPQKPAALGPRDKL